MAVLKNVLISIVVLLAGLVAMIALFIRIAFSPNYVSAFLGDADEQYYLCLSNHDPAPDSAKQPDYPKAFYWCDKAAKQNHPSAQVLLTQFYHQGIGVEPSLEQAQYWANQAEQQALAQQDGDALYALAQDYYYYVANNRIHTDKTRELYRQVAQWGNNLARISLGYKLLEDEQPNTTAAYAYLLQSEQADDNATVQCTLGEMNEHGIGSKQDLEQARQWYEQAAQHDDEILLRLADAYLLGTEGSRASRTALSVSLPRRLRQQLPFLHMSNLQTTVYPKCSQSLNNSSIISGRNTAYRKIP